MQAREKLLWQYNVDIPDMKFDVYDLAALAYLYKRVKETDVISEAHHIMDSFGILKKSYRNTVEVSDFATNILYHGRFSIYPVEPIVRHGNPVRVEQITDEKDMVHAAADICKNWQSGNGDPDNGLDTIAIVCRDQASAAVVDSELSNYVDVIESDPEKMVFGSGIMVLPVEYTKGLEFDAVLIMNPSREKYPVDDGHAKLLYVAATRALHELCVLHTGNLTGLIAEPAAYMVSVEEKVSASRPQQDRKQLKAITAKKQAVMPRKAKVKPAVLRTQDGLLQSELNRQNESVYTDINPNIKENNKANISLEKGSRSDIISKNTVSKENIVKFGDMPATEKLRPAGHGRIDLAVRWVTRQQDGIYLHSRYGVLRLSPIGSAIVRVTFAKGGQITDKIHDRITARYIDKRRMYKESGGTVELMTDELLLHVDKSTGAIRYMTRDKKLLLSEHKEGCRQMENAADGKCKTWLYLEWQKNENV